MYKLYTYPHLLDTTRPVDKGTLTQSARAHLYFSITQFFTVWQNNWQNKNHPFEVAFVHHFNPMLGD